MAPLHETYRHICAVLNTTQCHVLCSAGKSSPCRSGAGTTLTPSECCTVVGTMMPQCRWACAVAHADLPGSSVLYQVPATVPQGRAIKPYLPTIKPPKAPTLAPSCLPTLPMHRHAAISTAAPHMCASTDNEAPRSQYASSNAGTNPGARL